MNKSILFSILCTVSCVASISSEGDQVAALDYKRQELRRVETEYRVFLDSGPLDPHDPVAVRILQSYHNHIHYLHEEIERLKTRVAPDKKAAGVLLELRIASHKEKEVADILLELRQ